MRFFFFSNCIALLLISCTPTSNNPDGGLPGDGHTAPPPLAKEYSLKSEDSYPEGITFDPTTRSFYLGSLNHADITQVNAKGAEALFAKVEGEGVATLGLKVDPTHRRLWACSRVVTPKPEGTVLVFDLDTKKELSRFPLAKAAEGATCNDLALDQNGHVYITDPNNPNLYKIEFGTPNAQLFLSLDIFKPGIPGLGLNGIAVSPNQKSLLVVSYASGTLTHVPLDAPKTARAIELKGDSLDTPDGIVFLKEFLYVVSDKKIHRVTFTDATYKQGEVKSVPIDGKGLSTATIADEKLYVVKSEVFSYVLKSKPNLPFKILHIPLDLFGR